MGSNRHAGPLQVRNHIVALEIAQTIKHHLLTNKQEEGGGERERHMREQRLPSLFLRGLTCSKK